MIKQAKTLMQYFSELYLYPIPIIWETGDIIPFFNSNIHKQVTAPVSLFRPSGVRTCDYAVFLVRVRIRAGISLDAGSGTLNSLPLLRVRARYLS